MIQIEPVVTLSSLLAHPDADDMGLKELISNGYLDDMKDHYVPMSAVDQGESFEDVEELTILEASIIGNSMWCRGRLYDEGQIVALKVKGREGLWTVNTLDLGEQ